MFNKKKETVINDKLNKDEIHLKEDKIKETIVDNNGKKQKITSLEEVDVKLKDDKKGKSGKPFDDKYITKGGRTLKDFIAPDSIDRTHEDHLVINNKACRSFAINGFPNLVSIGWLDDFYSYPGDLDTTLFILPMDEGGALDELTRKITQFEAQLYVEQEKGNIRNITKLTDTVNQLYAQRRALEQNLENLFHVQVVATLYEKNLEELNKKASFLTDTLKGKRVSLSPLYLRQEEGYKSTLPIGEMYIHDKLRNFNTGALVSCFPFYNAEISHRDGVFLGINRMTSTPLLLDFYDRSILNNSNITVFGQAGAGKSFFLSLLTLRSALRGIRTVIIDPEGEYKKLTERMGGAYIKISPNVKVGINPFDIEEEYDEDAGRMVVNLREKIADNLNLIATMVGGLNKEEMGIVSSVLMTIYTEKGINENPESLIKPGMDFDNTTGKTIHNRKKDMPQISDFYRVMEAEAKKGSGNPTMQKIANSIRMYTDGSVFGLFDRQTSDGLTELFDKPIITFDVSQLEEGSLRPIGMYIALSWTWEKWVKKTPNIKKRIICDEAWMLVNKNMAGCEFTAQFLENCSRRIRKRNGGLLVASQNFVEFADNAQGKAVLTNSMVNIFLSQAATDIEAVGEAFKLSEGERRFLLTAMRGEMLIKCKGESSVANSFPLKCELELLN